LTKSFAVDCDQMWHKCSEKRQRERERGTEIE